jgi:hypothetical protein
MQAPIIQGESETATHPADLPPSATLLADRIVELLGVPPTMRARARENLGRRYRAAGEGGLKVVLEQAESNLAAMRAWLDIR